MYIYERNADYSMVPRSYDQNKRQIQSSLKLVDAVAEIIDARIPVSSRNPDLAKLVQNKPRVILLNKCDMANQTATKMWIDYFKKQNLVAIPVDCKSGRGLDKFAPAVNTVMSHKIARLKRKRNGKSHNQNYDCRYSECRQIFFYQ